jgi:pyruvate formate lyase activating enzyme
MVGETMTAADVLAEVEKDRVFYEESGGGVTFTGGEPLLQAAFLLECLAGCRERGCHTAVDTSGYAPEATLLEVAALTDLFLYDLKVMDDERHRASVGASNRLVLDNLRRLDERGSAVWLRFPLVPGVNDDEENIDALAAFVSTLVTPMPLHILPYHRYGAHKYERLGIATDAAAIEPPTEARVRAIADRLSSRGLIVAVGGSP